MKMSKPTFTISATIVIAATAQATQVAGTQAGHTGEYSPANIQDAFADERVFSRPPPRFKHAHRWFGGRGSLMAEQDQERAGGLLAAGYDPGKCGVRRLKAEALVVSLEMKVEGYFQTVLVKPPLMRDGTVMPMEQVCEDYKAFRLKTWGWFGFKKLTYNDFAKRKANGDPTKQELQGWKCGSSATFLYTKDPGSYKALNHLLSRVPNDAYKRLTEYNKEPATGSKLKHRFWLHAFRLIYHTIAEMQLRNAHLAAEKAIASTSSWASTSQRTQGGQAPLVVYESDGAAGTFKGVKWSKPVGVDADVDVLYRRQCMKSDNANKKFTLQFYNSSLPNRKFQFGGFLSTSARDDLSTFSGCGEDADAIFFTIEKKEATPCLLDATMSQYGSEKEYLFPPHSLFRVSEAPKLCPQPPGGPTPQPITCIGLTYAGAPKEEIDSAVKSRLKLSTALQRLLRLSKGGRC